MLYYLLVHFNQVSSRNLESRYPRPASSSQARNCCLRLWVVAVGRCSTNPLNTTVKRGRKGSCSDSRIPIHLYQSLPYIFAPCNSLPPQTRHQLPRIYHHLLYSAGPIQASPFARWLARSFGSSFAQFGVCGCRVGSGKVALSVC